MTKPARKAIVPPVVFWVLAGVTVALIHVLFSWGCDSGNDAAGRGMSKAFGEAFEGMGFAVVGLLAILFALIRNPAFRAFLTCVLVVPMMVLVSAVEQQYRFCQIVAQPMPPAPDDDVMMDPDPAVPPVRRQ